MIYQTWIIQSAVSLTNDILDSGQSPAVLSAIMKQQCTERARIVLNEAMDIHAGSSICVGYNNFLEKFYKSAPIGITVEGSNTLTRSLIIFGQGLNKSHPHVFPLLDSILNNDEKDFNEKFKNIFNHSIQLYFKSFSGCRALEQQIINFACLTNFVALRGGAIKKEQMLSGDMADIFSNLYLGICVNYYQSKYKTNEKLTKYIIQNITNENQIKINKIIDNLGYEKYLLLHLKKNIIPITYENERQIFKEIMQDPVILENIKKNIHIFGILEDMEKISKLQKSSKEYQELHDKIINVGEHHYEKLI